MISFRARLVLLDVEGTVSPLAFVHEVMFPFAWERAAGFLEKHAAEPGVRSALAQMAVDAGCSSVEEWCPFAVDCQEGRDWVVLQIHQWMAADAKLTGLKQLQGLIWEQGFNTGELCSTLFDDVAPVLRQWRESGVELRIYSSGSIHAQRLFFGHTVAGDLTPLLAGYYDTTTGSKRESASYAAIAAAAGQPAQDVLFLSDVSAELDAAEDAGMQTALAIRPGNRETESVRHKLFHSLHDISIVSR